MLVSARPLALVTLLLAVGLLTAVGAFAPSETPDIQLQLGQLLLAEGRYREAQTAFQQAVRSEESRVRVPARMGLVQSALRIAEFGVARSEAALLKAERPTEAQVLAIYGDAMWASGMFDEAERAYRDALSQQPADARAHAGLGRALAARTQYAEALDHGLTAVGLAPDESDYYQTVANAYERLGRFEDAAVAMSRFIALLPRGSADSRGLLARAELRFLRSFGKKVPYEIAGASDKPYVLRFRLENEKIVIAGRVNGGTEVDFVVDTGAELTTVSRQTAERRGVSPITYTISAGVGEVGLRGLQLGRIDKLEFGAFTVKNVPCIIKSPALAGLPTAEGDSLSPLALGMSMSVDYRRQVITLARHLPAEEGPADETMGLWMNRLATVRGTVGEQHARSFVVDTGGQVISISTATADSLARPVNVRRIPLKVYGASGWDRDAYLLPGVDLAFNDIRFDKLSVVVLNLRAPSVLLGYELGGIVGHQFLSRYRVSFDLEHAELRLKKT